ncbi:MAG: hypothetical protein RIC55_20320 [Pirellulaceae bacterium]
MEVTDPLNFGIVTLAESAPLEMTIGGDAKREFTVPTQEGEWRPPTEIARFLPDGFRIPLQCFAASDGLRRFCIGCSFEELIELGAVGGLAVLHRVRGIDSEVDHTYRAMHLIHQYVRGRSYRGSRGMREHLTREFAHSRDLYVRRSGRLADDERDVLPDDIGLSTRGEGHRLSVGQLTELGRRAAQNAGHANATSDIAIAYGLFEAAKLNPVEIEADRIPNLVKLALFDIDPAQSEQSADLVEIVYERLVAAIHRRLDDSQDDFDRWFSGPGNSIVKQIAQQKNQRGGRLRHEEVRQALLQLGWQAYGYVGPCIHALMRTIKNAIPDSLNDDERQLFENMYESQPCYGDLPLALLAERSQVIRLAVLAIWEEPDASVHVQILHRLLVDYADIARKRREADRRSKRRPVRDAVETSDSQADEENELQRPDEQQDRAGRSLAGVVELMENFHSPSTPEVDSFSQVADHIRGLHGIECDAACRRWEYRCDGESGSPVTIDIRCECGRVVRRLGLSVDEFAAHAERVLGWTRRAPGNPATGSEGPLNES